MNESQAKNFFAVLGVVFAVLVVIAVGCTDQREKDTVTLPVVTSSSGGRYFVTVVEGCEYIACYTHNGFWTLSHKGNCTNSIHTYKAEDGK